MNPDPEPSVLIRLLSKIVALMERSPKDMKEIDEKDVERIRLKVVELTKN